MDQEREIEQLRAEVASKSEQIGKLYRVCNERDVLLSAIGTWARARAAMNFVKINTPECAAAFDALGAAETALAALAATDRKGNVP